MKKNGEFVGVDDKYVPEDEKYVNDSLNDEIKSDIHDAYKGAKEYVSDKDNQEKMKNVGRKGLKIAKGIGIGYLAIIGFAIILAIVIIIIVFSNFFSAKKEADAIKNDASSMINEAYKQINDTTSSMDITKFNSDLESYSGTKNGSSVVILLDNVITKIKKNADHTITVIYSDTTTSNPDEITTLKKQFESTSKYEVSMDYDSNGYIYKITISNY